MNSPSLPAASTAAAFLRACALDVEVRKPGNVSAASAGHGMDAPLFLASAEAARTGLFATGSPVGTRIETAMAATLAVAGCNTNLGILLLCAPLAAAFEAAGAPVDVQALRAALRRVLDGLGVDDAAAAYRAIAAAHPAGLGTAAAQDVAAPPTVTLLQAMQLAAERDRVARQYATAFEDLFETGMPLLTGAADAEGRLPCGAVQSLFVAYLGRWPDSHIARKHGLDAAAAVTAQALPWRQRAARGERIGDDPAFADWDAALKAKRLNPGTTADLTVATLFVAGATGAVRLPSCIEIAPQMWNV